MSIIRLTEDLINKIAAGEVVERPASVVKELIENAIDAQATRIIIEVFDGGKERITVADNGIGMNHADAKLCLERHTTSKIKNTLDLFNIHTLGFRGEALASIAAVSKLDLQTKDETSDVGICIKTEGGKLISEEQIALPRSTSVEVTDLFFNVPARKKHLKSTATELKNIVDVATRYALLYPQIAFKLCHDGTILINVPTTPELLQRIASMYGARLVQDLLAVGYTKGDITVEGFISKPAAARNDRSLQHIYINKRWVRNDIISKAIYDACHTVLFLEKQPIVILNITIDPTKMDVNVHPTKTTVRLDKEQDVYQAVYEAVREVLYTKVLMPEVVLQERKRDAQSSLHVPVHAPLSKPLFDREVQTPLPVHQEAQNATPSTGGLSLHQPQRSSQHTSLSGTPQQKLRILGRIKETFIVGENDLGMVLIDQHAMHERIMYEKFMEQFFAKSIQKQELLQPIPIELTPSEQVTLHAHTALFSGLGFDVEKFGQHTLVIRTWPSVFGRMQRKELMYDLLAELHEKPLKTDEIKEERLVRRACRSAVKAHDSLELPEIYAMIEELHRCKMPYTCPHGRPTMIQFTAYELEKKFKRVH